MEVDLPRARISGGRLERKGTYEALVDGGPDDVVEGCAFEVRSKEEEKGLLEFETCAYGVVRCEIRLEGDEVVRGLTFRIGDRQGIGRLRRLEYSRDGRLG